MYYVHLLVHTIDLWNCNQITDKGLEYLKGARIHY